jgi:hypothetical protein
VLTGGKSGRVRRLIPVATGPELVAAIDRYGLCAILSSVAISRPPRILQAHGVDAQWIVRQPPPGRCKPRIVFDVIVEQFVPKADASRGSDADDNPFSPIAHLQAMDAGAGPQESPVQAVAGSAKQPVLLSREHAEIPAARQFSADVVGQHGA